MSKLADSQARYQRCEAQCKEFEEGNRFLRAEIARLRDALTVCKRWIYETPDDGNDKGQSRKNYALNEITLILASTIPPKPTNEEVDRIDKLIADLQAAADNVAFIKEELSVSVRRITAR